LCQSLGLFGKDIAGEAESGGGGFANAIMDANKNYQAPKPKGIKQKGISADDAEVILKA